MSTIYQKKQYFSATIYVFLVLSLLAFLFSFGPGTDDEPLGTENLKGVKYSEDNDTLSVYLNAITINTASDEGKALRKAAKEFAGKKMHLVKFAGAIQPAWHKMLTDMGAEIIDYIPNYTYLVFVNSSSLKMIQQEAAKKTSPITWEAEYLPAYRISPDVYGKTSKGAVDPTIIPFDKFKVQLFADEETNTATIAALQKMQNDKTFTDNQSISHYINITVALSPSSLKMLSQMNDVISITPYIEPKRRDESQNIIMTGQLTGNAPTAGNYLSYLANKGFTQAQFDASGFVVNLSDDGLDSGSVANVMNPTSHFALFKNGDKAQPSRVAFIHKAGTATDAGTKGCEGHGNLNTHIVGGFVSDALITNSNHADANSFRYNLGVAPFVRVGNTTIFSPNYTNPNLRNLESESYRDGGRISSNSWGSNSAGAYTADAQAYDFLVRDAQPAGSTVPAAGNQEMVILFSAGNAGSGAGTIGSPGTGKNVITVGASEGVRAFGGVDGCGVLDVGANSAFDIATFSSRGPCTDGRKKPDIMAPGTHITGGAYQSNIATVTTGTGSGASCFLGNGVCGGVGNKFFPATQQWTTASSGTSHSCPAVAGFAALIRQNFINKGFTAPSPAMTKAVIVNSAGYMNGLGANDNLFSNNQGMGLVNMNNYFTALDNANIRRDQVSTDVFTATGQSRVRTGVVTSAGLPVRVTLAYTDAPGSTTGNAYVNNLDLEVTVNGVKYLGNVFTAAQSIAGGVADVRNNVESVFLPAGINGNIAVKVIATNIAGDGIPNNASPLDQDYALIVTNTTEQAAPALASAGPSITSESCGSGFVPDPNELLSVSLPVTNEGTLATNNLVATLQANAGIINPTGAQSYGALAPSASLSRPFSFYVSTGTPCGSIITLTWSLTDGAQNLGTVSKTYKVGSQAMTLSQNFDAVTAPALPSGWTQNQITGTTINWVSSTTTPNSAPNTMFANNPATINATALESPSFLVTITDATVGFQKAFTTESTYDGVVFEIKIGNGAWTDILTAGGSFITGGYNAVINSNATNGSPIVGRSAWSGTSAAFTSTLVMLPSAASGQNVQVRWLMASDNTVASTGFRLDDVLINASFSCTPCGTLPLNLLSFTGAKRDGYNLLQWKTANEINTNNFVLQYSVDGSNFKNAYNIAAIGSGNNNYQQKDNGEWIKDALIFYRLKMIDHDGQFTFSNIVTIKNNSAAKLASAIYPNPTKENCTLTIGERNLIGTSVQVFDIAGKLLQTKTIEYNTQVIYMNNYLPGVYLIKLVNGETFRIIKL